MTNNDAPQEIEIAMDLSIQPADTLVQKMLGKKPFLLFTVDGLEGDGDNRVLQSTVMGGGLGGSTVETLVEDLGAVIEMLQLALEQAESGNTNVVPGTFDDPHSPAASPGDDQ